MNTEELPIRWEVIFDASDFSVEILLLANSWLPRVDTRYSEVLLSWILGKDISA